MSGHQGQFLPSGWKYADFAPGEGARSGASELAFDDEAWSAIDVPGDIHRTLLAEGRIDDPYYDQNELACTWVEDREWWYRLQFSGPDRTPHADERDLMVFHGLDTFVTVWLNGQKLGTSSNMFREVVYDVTGELLPGQLNTLALCFDRPLDHLDGFEGFQSIWGRNLERVFMRKAQFSYGWDWGPRLPNIGIWRPVEWRREQQAAITGIHFYTLEIAADRSEALVGVRVEVEPFATQHPVQASISLHCGDDLVASTTLAIEGDAPRSAATAHLKVANPQLWWTNDLGEATLYQLRVELSQSGLVLDSKEQAVGIRTIHLDQSPDPDQPGTRFFRFVLNEVPIFAKGANWIPADSFVGAISRAHYERLLGLARDAHMNMLRVWGGGIYEHDAFYEICDRLGILVWQDFMFSCAMYPENNADFVAEVEAEARYQVQRLRHHPCLALWCGNNENQWLHDLVYWNAPGTKVPGSLYYDHVLPRVVAEVDGVTPYWPSSPYGGNDHNDMADGDRHNWDVWHGGFPRRFGEPPRRDIGPDGVTYYRYAEDMGRFISEFGMHAAPVYETLRRNIPPDQLYHHSPSMDHHNKDTPKNKGDNLMLSVTGLPETLEEYIDFSMIAQAEGLKYGIEHFRRRKPQCSGTLFWQFNDCWPVLSWSVVDYYGFGKAGYYYARRFYAPAMASFKQTADGGVELWVVNDTLEEVVGTVRVTHGHFDGGEARREEKTISVPANSSRVVASWAPDKLDSGPDRYLAVTSDLFPPNRHFFAPVKDMRRQPASVRVEHDVIDPHTLSVRLTTDCYAFFVHLIVPHETTQFSENYFDLEPGETRTILVSNEHIELTPDMVTVVTR